MASDTWNRAATINVFVAWSKLHGMWYETVHEAGATLEIFSRSIFFVHRQNMLHFRNSEVDIGEGNSADSFGAWWVVNHLSGTAMVNARLRRKMSSTTTGRNLLAGTFSSADVVTSARDTGAQDTSMLKLPPPPSVNWAALGMTTPIKNQGRVLWTV